MRYLLFLLCLLTVSNGPVYGSQIGSKELLIIAHRGNSGHAPEHTMAAYEQATLLKADYVEIDLGMTRDGHLIAIHDTTVNRTTNGMGKVNSLTLSQIKRLDAGSSFNKHFPDKANSEYIGLKIPSLKEVINHYGTSINYYIEIKKPQDYPTMTKELLKVLKSYQLIGEKAYPGKVIIESFHSESLKYIHKKYPNLVLVQLGDSPEQFDLSQIASYAAVVGPNCIQIDRKFVNKSHDKDLLVHCWTVNNEEDIKNSISLGVDGIFTNDVNLAKKTANNYH